MIRNIIKQTKKDIFYSQFVFGLRGDNHNFNIGDDCFTSFDPAKENLRGTCAISITEEMTDQEIQNRIEQAKEYGRNIYLIAGDDWGKGEDKNERIIHDAQVLAIIT